MDKTKITEEYFVKIVEEEKDLMFRLAYNIMQNTADSEDVVAESICKACEKRASLKSPAKLRNWMLRITVNIAKNTVILRNRTKPVEDCQKYYKGKTDEKINIWELVGELKEKEGLFPEKKIIEVSQKNKVKKGQLTFCYENSTFYIPDNEMTDEEILEIIDFWERRDYAVKEKNSENNNSDKLKNANQKIDDKAAVKIANEVLQKAYGMDTDSAEINIEFDYAELTENKSLPSYFVSLSKKSWKYDATVEVDSKNGTINQINVSHKTKNECVSGIKVNEDSYRENTAKIYHILDGIGKKDSDAQEIYLVYKYRKNGILNRGNVKYLVKMKDGGVLTKCRLLNK